jgi:AcrR family transcriptional regulator
MESSKLLGVTETKPTINPSRTARRAAANREAIIDAAEELLVEGGLGAVTVEAVAERADVALQTVYNRVGRRPEVLVAIAERAVEENRRYMDAAFTSGGTPLDRIVAAAQAYVRFAHDRPQQFRLLSSPPDEPQALERIADKIDEQVGKLAEVLAAGAADGSFASSLKPDVAATALWAMMDGTLALGWRADRKVVGPESLREIAEFSLSTILNGIKPR